ncbi:unnamed protein product [Hymenolepis diminuta]|uniref:Sodium channel protein n=3 Tax=Hymenolepis diminuta TaxID=6216 RepID=A0A0R3S7V5_HYMDI|nr:unnamed protein product [Hymenolepis diminuta]
MSSEDCSKLPPQTFVLPQFIPLTRESAHLSLQRYERQKRREKRAKEILREQKRKRKEWIQKKFNMDNDRSEVENSTYAPHSSVHVDEGLIEPRSDEDDSFEMPEKPNPMLVAGKKLIPPLASKFCSRRYTGKPLQEMDDFYRYIMFVVPSLGNLSALRSLRVLRALKTVTAVRGLKTIIGALMDAVMHLRDVAVLTLFMLSIFALIGVQLYRGTLLRKCVIPWPGTNTTAGRVILSQLIDDIYHNKTFDEDLSAEIKDIFNRKFPAFLGNYLNNLNVTKSDDFQLSDDMVTAVWSTLTNYSRWQVTEYFYEQKVNWMSPHMVCRNLTEEGNSTCPVDFICKQTRIGNPNFGYTNFDNFASALLCSFRLITQDYWESLYQLVLRANGPTHVFFFGMVIFLGSFYLLNIILAIVSMSYEQVCKQDMESDAQIAAAISVISKMRIPRRWKSEDVLLKHGGVVPTKIWESAVLFADEFSVENVSYSKGLNSLSPISNKDQISLVSAELSNVSEASILSSVDRNVLGNGNSNGITLGEPDQNGLAFYLPQYPLASEEKPLNQNFNDFPLSGPKYCLKNKTDKDLRALKKQLCSNICGQQKELPEHPECCKKVIKEFCLPVRVWRYIAKQTEAVLCGWTCCPCYYVFRRYVSYFILDPFVELFITLCIVINTIFMAIDQPEKGEALAHVLRIANYFFTTTFTVEAALKLIALGTKEYFADSWNIFDFVVVFFSLVEIPLTNIRGLSILRAFRLLRVFKLAKSWQTMKLLFSIVAMTLNALGNLTAVLIISIFVFAVLGMSLFGENYKEFMNTTRFPDRGGKIPRWNFCDFTHSFMIVFRVLCGEWIESMWDCLEVNGWSCTIFFLMTMVLGNLVVLSLFLALLLSSFSAESFQKEEEAGDQNKLQIALDRIYRFGIWMQLSIRKIFTYRTRRYGARSRMKGTNHVIHETQIIHLEPPGTINNNIEEGDVVLQNPISLEESMTVSDFKFKSRSCGHSPENVPILRVDSPISSMHKTSDISSPRQDFEGNEENPVEDENDPEQVLEAESVDMAFWEHPEDCCAPWLWNLVSPLCKGVLSSKVGVAWRRLRQSCYYIVENRYFESFIFLMIIISSGTLALEDKNLPSRPRLKMALDYMDKIFTFIFLMEMILKWFAYGLRKFFSDAWCWLDFTIVTVSMTQNTLKWLYNNIIIIAVTSMILSYGKTDGKTSMNSFKAMRTLRALRPLRALSRWEGMRLVVNALLQAIPSICNVVLATFKGWVEIMADAVDITDYDQQPVYNNATIYYLFFVVFIIVGAFFTLNLFIGVIIQNFNMQKKKAGGSLELFMTEDQKKYYQAMKKMVRRTPQKPIPKPRLKVSRWIFKIISNRKFDLFILGMIGLNTLIMCFEHHRQSEAMKHFMEIINKVFVIIFTFEFVLKLIGQRWYYFKDPWNIFDCCIVIFSLVCWGVEDLMTTLPVPPTTIRIVRLFRVGRVLRLVKSARGIRTLLFALIVSLPALFNVALLLFLTAFVYSIVGMSFFGKVAYYAGIDAEFNFETFPQAFIILLQISTSAGRWSTVFEGLSNTDPAYCSVEEGTCGNFLWATLFLVSYLVISFMVIINMYIAVILENFSQATEDVQQGLTQDEFDAFYEVWELYDTHALGFIELKYLEEFVEKIGPPLGIPRPNRIRLACLSVQICSHDRIFCMDLLDALTRNFLGRLTTEHPETLVEQVEIGINSTSATQEGGIDRTNFVAKAAKEPVVPISNTYERQRKRMAAYKILYFWRRHGRRKLSGAKKLTTDQQYYSPTLETIS